MLLYDDLPHYLYTLLASPAFQQIAPLVIILVVPTLVLFINSHRHTVAANVLMVFDTLALILPWNWSENTSHGSGSSDRRKLKRKQHARSRDDQVARTSSQGTQRMCALGEPAMNGALDSSYDSSSEDGYYPGLVNISGTYCFMNSTVQVSHLLVAALLLALTLCRPWPLYRTCNRNWRRYMAPL